MKSNKKILNILKEFILAQDNASHDDKYWLSVIKGLKYLFLLKDSIKDKEALMNSFYKLKEEILNETNNPFIEDLIDELNAILIHYYPMPDFWNSTIYEFRSHVNFERYFNLLDKEDNVL